MKRSRQVPIRRVKLLLVLGVLLPFLVASFTSQLLCSKLVERLLSFGSIFLFVFLIFWIVANTIRQLLEE
ncbi:hypothetical protein [Pontibacter ramchanderi]|nr:hypothetical protein [Pontibacter ramchanderi]